MTFIKTIREKFNDKVRNWGNDTYQGLGDLLTDSDPRKIGLALGTVGMLLTGCANQPENESANNNEPQSTASGRFTPFNQRNETNSSRETAIIDEPKMFGVGLENIDYTRHSSLVSSGPTITSGPNLSKPITEMSPSEVWEEVNAYYACGAYNPQFTPQVCFPDSKEELFEIIEETKDIFMNFFNHEEFESKMDETKALLDEGKFAEAYETGKTTWSQYHPNTCDTFKHFSVLAYFAIQREVARIDPSYLQESGAEDEYENRMTGFKQEWGNQYKIMDENRSEWSGLLNDIVSAYVNALRTDPCVQECAEMEDIIWRYTFGKLNSAAEEHSDFNGDGNIQVPERNEFMRALFGNQGINYPKSRMIPGHRRNWIKAATQNEEPITPVMVLDFLDELTSNIEEGNQRSYGNMLID